MPTVQDYGHRLDATNFADYSENWRRCLSDDIPDLFYAYDTVQNRTERLSSFRIQGTALGELVAATNDFSAGYRLYVRLVLRPGYKGVDQIPSEPFFYPIVQVASTSDKGLNDENGFMPSWDANPAFIQSTTNSGIDEIPGAGAYLFVEKWLATPHADLASCFELTAAYTARRVWGYKFSVDESQAIVEAIHNAHQSGGAQLSVHLGSSFVVNTHPVAFRPVLEVANVTSGVAILEDKGNGYYDFSNPVPPFSAGG